MELPHLSFPIFGVCESIPADKVCGLDEKVWGGGDIFQSPNSPCVVLHLHVCRAHLLLSSCVYMHVHRQHCLHSYDWFYRFFSRTGGFLSFTLDTSLPPNSHHYSLPATRRLVAYIFHPFEPFVISIQKTSMTEYVVCFHIRNPISSPTW